MRIGIDASRAFGDQRTGTENYSYQLISHLATLPESREHEFILYVKSDPNLKFEIRNLKLIENWKLKIVNLSLLWTQAGLAARTWVDKLDVLWVPAHTLPVLRKPGIKTVVTIHGIEYEWLPAYENRLQRWYLPLSTKYAVHSARRIIAVSNFTKKQLVERLGAPAEKIKVIHEGVERNLKFKILNLKSILKKFNLQKKKYILFIGTVQPRKNLKRLIQAFSMLNAKCQMLNSKLVIAGKLGWGYEEVLVAPKKLGVEDRVVFTGYISDTERDTLLQNALVYVQPSITEGFGLPILEAFENNVPVVSSRGGALAEVVGDAGLLFDPLDIKEIGHKIQRIVSEKNLRDELVKRGRERLKVFSWEKAAKMTYKILTDW